MVVGEGGCKDDTKPNILALVSLMRPGLQIVCHKSRDGSFKLLIPPVYLAWRAGTTTLFLIDPSPHRLFQHCSSRQSGTNLKEISQVAGNL